MGGILRDPDVQRWAHAAGIWAVFLAGLGMIVAVAVAAGRVSAEHQMIIEFVKRCH